MFFKIIISIFSRVIVVIIIIIIIIIIDYNLYTFYQLLLLNVNFLKRLL